MKILSVLMNPAAIRGLLLILTAFGVQIRPEDIESIIAGGLAASGVVGIISSAMGRGDQPK